MRIRRRPISRTNAPYVIAELGVNHDGSVEKALALTRACARARVEAIKLQYFEADRLISRAGRLAAYQAAAGESDPVEMLRRLELSIDEMGSVVDLAHSLGMHAIVTVFSAELVEQAEVLPWDAYKTASPDIINKPLLDALEATGKPLIISTGASTLREVGRALSWLKAARSRLAVMQCVSSYPTSLDDAALGGIDALADIFDGPIGYSDHTESVKTGCFAVIAGAALLEKHVTLDKAAKGPDHAASLLPEELRTYRKYARVARRYEANPELKQMLDTYVSLDSEKRAYALVQRLREQHDEHDKRKDVLPVEEDVRRLSRQSLVSTRALPAGHTITRADLTVKRPGTGIPPYELDATIGRQLARAVGADTPLTPDDLSPAA